MTSRTEYTKPVEPLKQFVSGVSTLTDSALIAYSSLPDHQLEHALEADGKSPEDINKIVKDIRRVKKYIAAFAQRFKEELQKKNIMFDTTELLNKGLKIALKNKMSEGEKKLFLNELIGNDDTKIAYKNDLRLSSMAKLLGYDRIGMRYMKYDKADEPVIRDLYTIFHNNKFLFNDVKRRSLMYTDCAMEALSGSYDSRSHIVGSHIHPVIMAFFVFPKIELFDRFILRSSIARMVLKKRHDKQMNLYENALAGEVEGEEELAGAIASDPATLYVDNPLQHIARRALCQIELWKLIDAGRNGNYYAKSYNSDISNFMSLISQYDYHGFNIGESSHIMNEVTILRKILGIFSIRPTRVAMSSISSNMSPIYANISSIAKVKYTDLQTINISLPSIIFNQQEPINLSASINQKDWLIENGSWVPRNRTIVSSVNVVFFVIGRRANISADYDSTQMGFANLVMPTNYSALSTLNDTQVVFDKQITLGRETFAIKSAVVLETAPRTKQTDPFIIIGSVAFIVKPDPSGMFDRYLIYNPGVANIMRDVGGQQQTLPPITMLREHAQNINDPDDVAFVETIERKGSILLYVKSS